MLPLYNELAHMADVEDPGVTADGLVLVVDAGIADGHVIAREFDHFGAKCGMERSEGRALHGKSLWAQM
jgi:hypothetical protein